MPRKPSNPSDISTPIEVVIGIVSGIGADIETSLQHLSKELESCDASINTIKLSDHFATFSKKIFRKFEVSSQNVIKSGDFSTLGKFSRLDLKMNIGSEVCNHHSHRDFWARVAVSEIAKKRGSLNPEKKIHIYIVDSFKRPEEIELMNQVYGRSFIQLSVFTPERLRFQNLANQIAAEDNDSNLSTKRKSGDLPPVFVHLQV